MKELKISKQLLKLRKSMNLTQEKMAKEMHLSVVTYNKLEKGCKNLTTVTIEKIHDFTGWSPSFIEEHL